MNIDWLTNDKNSAVTIYNNNITLSKRALLFFEDSYCVVVGIDRDTKNLIIKKFNKEEYEKEIKDANNAHKIEIKKSCGRINSKVLVEKISKVLNLDFTNQTSYKYDATWHTGYKMLIVSTGGENNI